MESKGIRNKVISSLFWKFMERGSVQGVHFVISIILARLLSPDDYGLKALLMVFIIFANIFIQQGFISALIQKKDADETDFSSAFYVSLLIAVLFYLLLFVSAPTIATFYASPSITLLLRVMSLSLFLGVFNAIQSSALSKNMQFKKLFFSNLCAVIVSGATGIALAFKGFGVWALIGQQLSNQAIALLVMWFTVKWRPKLLFSFEKTKSILAYGWKILAAAIINAFYENIRILTIGRMYAPEALGFYDKGEQFPKLIMSSIDGSIQSVMFPAFSLKQDDKQKIKNMMERSIATSAFILCPAMFGLAAIAEPLIILLLTDKWLPSVPFLQLACISYALWPIHTSNMQVINALGRSDIFLKTAVIKAAIGLIILSISVFYGVHAIAIGVVVYSFVGTFINMYPNAKLINYNWKEQWGDILPGMGVALIMGIVVYNITWFNSVTMLSLAIKILSGIAVYILLSKLFKLESFDYILNMAKEYSKKRK